MKMKRSTKNKTKLTNKVLNKKVLKKKVPKKMAMKQKVANNKVAGNKVAKKSAGKKILRDLDTKTKKQARLTMSTKLEKSLNKPLGLNKPGKPIKPGKPTGIIIIDDKNYAFADGENILNVARRNSIQIPSLCYDEDFPHSTSCFICIVKDTTSGKFLPSCSTKARDGMQIVSSDDEIIKYRKMALELLLSEHDADCFSPCKTSCPAGIDVRDYILYTRDKNEFKGFTTIRKSNPLVSVVGRVCPAFCEKDCSRNHIDETVSIRLLKRHIGDTVYEKFDKELFEHEKKLIKAKTGKKVAVIGSGPAGLSAAYYLCLAGCRVKIFEAMPKPGGMLRYAIPSYRLPEDVLDKEINGILRLGIELETNIRIDKDALDELSKDYDDIIVAVGTWRETALGLGEEKIPSTIPAVEFLRSVRQGTIPEGVKGKVVVIGGGNSAIDAARTALRLGAKTVNLVYRRTRAQMPANSEEINDALSEGVILHELLSPLELNEGKLKFRKMILSDELDRSGRNKIKDTDKVQDFEFDLLVYAIGQKPEPELLGHNYVCGDAKNGASTVIEAVADGKKMARTITNILGDGLEFYSVREAGLLASRDNKKIARILPEHLDPKTRIKDFCEVELDYSGSARSEAKRCINCGCAALDDCDLRKYAIEYGADPVLYRLIEAPDPSKSSKPDVKTGVSPSFSDDSLKFMLHEPSKCIKCGRCINVCDNVAGANALSFIGRGLDVVLSSNNKNNISDSTCILCGMCIDHCPTGSLIEKNDELKWTDLEEKVEECKGCILGCKIKYAYSDGKILRARSFDTPICSIGRWGWMDGYSLSLGYYKGKQDTLSAEFVQSGSIAKGPYTDAFWDKFDLIATLDYSAKAENPRVLYELNRLTKRGKRVFNIQSKKDLLQIKDAKKILLIFNLFHYKKELLEAVLDNKKLVKLLPVYYR